MRAPGARVRGRGCVSRLCAGCACAPGAWECGLRRPCRPGRCAPRASPPRGNAGLLPPTPAGPNRVCLALQELGSRGQPGPENLSWLELRGVRSQVCRRQKRDDLARHPLRSRAGQGAPSPYFQACWAPVPSPAAGHPPATPAAFCGPSSDAPEGPCGLFTSRSGCRGQCGLHWTLHFGSKKRPFTMTCDPWLPGTVGMLRECF